MRVVALLFYYGFSTTMTAPSYTLQAPPALKTYRGGGGYKKGTRSSDARDDRRRACRIFLSYIARLGVRGATGTEGVRTKGYSVLHAGQRPIHPKNKHTRTQRSETKNKKNVRGTESRPQPFLFARIRDSRHFVRLALLRLLHTSMSSTPCISLFRCTLASTQASVPSTYVPSTIFRKANTESSRALRCPKHELCSSRSCISSSRISRDAQK